MPTNEEQYLKEIRDLLVLLLRKNDVSSAAIGAILGISAKSVMNRYPIKGPRGEQETSEPMPEPAPSEG